MLQDDFILNVDLKQMVIVFFGKWYLMVTNALYNIYWQVEPQVVKFLVQIWKWLHEVVSD